MKLQSRNMGGVQSLGQVDIGAPGRKWQAKTQAKNAMARAFSEGARQINVLFKAQDDVGGELELQRRLFEDGRSHELSLVYLENNPSLDLVNGEGSIPPKIYDHAKAWAQANPDAQGNTPQYVNTHEFIDTYMQQEYKETMSASVDALEEYGLSADYVKAIDESVINGSGTALKIKLKQRQEDLKAQADEQFQAAVMANDETSATIIAANNVTVRAWTPEVAGEKLAKLGPQLDYNVIDEGISNASSQSELDAINSQIELSRVLPEDRPKLRSKMRVQQNYFTKLSGEAQARNYETAMAMNGGGTLTREWITTQVAKHKLTGGQANTLFAALNQVDPAKSSPQTMDFLNTRIAWIRYGDTNEDTTVTDRAQQVRKEIQRQVNGVNPDGTTFVRTIKGGDLQDMYEEVDKIESAALGKNMEPFKLAKTQIKSFTGYSDTFEKTINGPYPAGVAKANFETALQNHMDSAGVDADPVEFVAKNASKYTAEIYTQKQLDRLALQYPQYAQYLKDTSIIPFVVLAQAWEDHQIGALPWDDFENIRRNLAYLGVDLSEFRASQPKPSETGIGRRGDDEQ